MSRTYFFLLCFFFVFDVSAVDYSCKVDSSEHGFKGKGKGEGGGFDVESAIIVYDIQKNSLHPYSGEEIKNRVGDANIYVKDGNSYQPIYLQISNLPNKKGGLNYYFDRVGVCGNYFTLQGDFYESGFSFLLKIESREKSLIWKASLLSDSKFDTGWKVSLQFPSLAFREKLFFSDRVDLFHRNLNSSYKESFRYPLLLQGSQDFGMAVAVPPNKPVRFSTRFSKGYADLSFYIGTSSETKPSPNQADFEFVSFSSSELIDYRSALSSYYDLFFEHFKVFNPYESFGLWAPSSPQGYLDHKLFYFHEHGNIFHSLSSSSGASISSQVELDNQYKWGLFPYLHIGQISSTQLGFNGKGVDPNEHLGFDKKVFSPQQAKKYSSVDVDVNWPGARTDSSVHLNSVLNASVLFDEDGDVVSKYRNTRLMGFSSESSTQPIKEWDSIGHQISYFINPSPTLKIDGVDGHGAYMLDWVKKVVQRNPGLKGIYVDSIKSWASARNFRREHFQFSEYPLASLSDGSVYLPNAWGYYQFLSALKVYLKQHNMMLFVNGYATGERFFHSTLSDVVGGERSTSKVMGGEMHHLVIAPNKVRLRLGSGKVFNLRNKLEDHINTSLAIMAPTSAWGSYFSKPEYVNRDEGFATAHAFPLYRRDKDLWDVIFKNLNVYVGARWMPVKLAEVKDKGFRLERFLDKSGVSFFSVYGEYVKGGEVEILIDKSAFSGLNIKGFYDLHNEKYYSFNQKSQSVTFALIKGEGESFVSVLYPDFF